MNADRPPVPGHRFAQSGEPFRREVEDLEAADPLVNAVGGWMVRHVMITRLRSPTGARPTPPPRPGLSRRGRALEPPGECPARVGPASAIAQALPPRGAPP